MSFPYPQPRPGIDQPSRRQRTVAVITPPNIIVPPTGIQGTDFPSHPGQSPFKHGFPTHEGGYYTEPATGLNVAYEPYNGDLRTVDKRQARANNQYLVTEYYPSSPQFGANGVTPANNALIKGGVHSSTSDQHGGHVTTEWYAEEPVQGQTNAYLDVSHIYPPVNSTTNVPTVPSMPQQAPNSNQTQPPSNSAPGSSIQASSAQYAPDPAGSPYSPHYPPPQLGTISPSNPVQSSSSSNIGGPSPYGGATAYGTGPHPGPYGVAAGNSGPYNTGAGEQLPYGTVPSSPHYSGNVQNPPPAPPTSAYPFQPLPQYSAPRYGVPAQTTPSTPLPPS